LKRIKKIYINYLIKKVSSELKRKGVRVRIKLQRWVPTQVQAPLSLWVGLKNPFNEVKKPKSYCRESCNLIEPKCKGPAIVLIRPKVFVIITIHTFGIGIIGCEKKGRRKFSWPIINFSAINRFSVYLTK